MATHSSVLAWRIPGTGEPGGLPSMGSHRVGHDWSDLAAAALWYIRSGIFPAVSVNKGGHSYQQSQPSQWRAGEPWGNSGRKEYLPSIIAAIRLQSPPAVSPEETQDVETQDTGPRQLRCIPKEWFQWARTLASTHTAIQANHHHGSLVVQ